LIAAFAVYLVSIGYGIYIGMLDTPEDADDDDEGESSHAESEISPLLSSKALVEPILRTVNGMASSWYSLSPENQRSMTVIKAVSAAGWTIPLVIIIQGKWQMDS
jgi:hypothetical protein